MIKAKASCLDYGVWHANQAFRSRSGLSARAYTRTSRTCVVTAEGGVADSGFCLTDPFF